MYENTYQHKVDYYIFLIILITYKNIQSISICLMQNYIKTIVFPQVLIMGGHYNFVKMILWAYLR